MTMHQNPRLHLMCSCGGEMLVVEVDNDPRWTDFLDPDFNFAFFERGHGFPMTWRERIRLCWKILTCGTSFTDEVILKWKEVKQLVDFLLEKERRICECQLEELRKGADKEGGIK